MSKEKQIEEMAELICDNKCDNGICSTDGWICNYNCEYKYSAEALFEAGYRKQSEVAREIFEEIKGLYVTKVIMDGEVLYDTTEWFNAVKKKYTEEK